MNIFFRTLIILVVTTIIGGLMFAGVTVLDTLDDNGQPDVDVIRLPSTESREFRPDGDDQDGRDGGFGFPGGIIKTLALMSIAGGVYSVIVWTSKQAKRSAAR